MATKEHKLAAIVFTDIVGYTKRMEENEQNTMILLQKQREIIFPMVTDFGGEIIKEIGDGLLLMFSSAIQAVRFAIETQTRLKDEELTIRAGIHIGDVIFEEGDVYGSAVNTAARIEPLAPPNGICISEDVRNQIKNKTEIKTRSIGKKVLKGVHEPMEIYEILLDDLREEEIPVRVSFWKDIWDRRVIQILAIYLVLSWLIKTAVSAIVNNFFLSPYLEDLTWVILLSLIPTVILISYFHGKNRGRWNRVQTIGLPVNLAITVMLVLFIFKGKDLGATTETKIIKDEEGKNVELTVYKNEFRKKILIFFYENESGDTSLNWIQYAIPSLLDYDMSQNYLLQVQPANASIQKFKEAGYKKGTGAPFMLQKDIAQYYNTTHFITGTFEVNTENFKLATKLFETSTGKLLSEFLTEDSDFFKCLDKVTKTIYEAMEIPSNYLQSSNDLPVSEIFTSSRAAAEFYTRGNIEIILDNNWEKATQFTQRAIEIDPGFAVAYSVLAEYYFNSNQVDKAEVSLQKAMDNIYRLPERLKFSIKFFHYLLKQEPDKAIAVVKMWIELFPEDIEARELLALRYQYKNMFQEAVEIYRGLMAIDPEQSKYIRYIGNLYETMGNYDSAVYYYENFTENHPEDFKAYMDLGEMYLNLAEFEKAAENLDKALILDPGNVNVSLSRILVDLRQGKFEIAEDRYHRLLKSCPTANDTAMVYKQLSDYYEGTGQILKSLLYQQKFVEEIKKLVTPLNYTVYQLFSIDKYVKAGKLEEGYQLIKDSEKKFQHPVDKVVSFGYMFYYIEADSADKAATYVDIARDLAISFGEEMLLNNVDYSKGRIHLLKMEYDSALVYFDSFIERSPTNKEMIRYISECYRGLKETKKAEKAIETALKYRPNNPYLNYEAALVFIDKNDRNTVSKYLQKALEAWKNADGIYKPAQEAKKLSAELRGV
ncbi:MAG: tetratricopeptide repeat protein [Bacteroidales bacterium]|nr:tetratricopeptide repeat protein [Bacteroidales bacterium]